MNPIHRIILTVVRLLACGFLLVGILKVMLYWAKCHLDHAAVRAGRCAYYSIPAVIGLVMLAGSLPLAGWMKQHHDDDDVS